MSPQLEIKQRIAPAACLPRLIEDSAAFEASWRLERDRSDRSGLPFCMILFEEAEQEATLQEFLLQRLRSTDVVGRLDGLLAALLPYTNPVGASVVAADVEAWSAERDAGVKATIFVYPGDSGLY